MQLICVKGRLGTVTNVPSRLLVIDASVACSCGDNEAVHPRAKQCRDFLIATLRICHKVVITPASWAEWKKHQSGFASRWRVSMTARKKVIRVTTEERTDAQKQVQLSCHGKRLAKAMKDCHLLDAALATELSVISLDEEVREIYRSLCEDAKILRKIVWVNPTLESEAPVDWLKQGAQSDAHRQLGYKADS